MKKRQTIRLTESQLHRVIKESVKRILKETNEVRAYGKSFHGDKAEDWTELEMVRNNNKKKYSAEAQTDKEKEKLVNKNAKAEHRNSRNAFDLDTRYGQACYGECDRNSRKSFVKARRSYNSRHPWVTETNDFEHIKSQVMDVAQKMAQEMIDNISINGKEDFSLEDVAEKIGLNLEGLNKDDYYFLHDIVNDEIDYAYMKYLEDNDLDDDYDLEDYEYLEYNQDWDDDQE